MLSPNCTDLIQLIDAEIGLSLKTRMGKALDDWLLLKDSVTNTPNYSLWLGAEGHCYPAWKRRVLISKLAADAWDSMCKPTSEGGFDFENAGKRTGMLQSILPMEKIKLHDIEEISLFENNEILSETTSDNDTLSNNQHETTIDDEISDDVDVFFRSEIVHDTIKNDGILEDDLDDNDGEAFVLDDYLDVHEDYFYALPSAQHFRQLKLSEVTLGSALISSRYIILYKYNIKDISEYWIRWNIHSLTSTKDSIYTLRYNSNINRHIPNNKILSIKDINVQLEKTQYLKKWVCFEKIKDFIETE